MQKQDHIETDEHGVAHSVIGASSMSRIEKCPASVRLHKALLKAGYKQKSNEHSKRGTAVHTLIELYLSTNWPLASFEPVHAQTGYVYTQEDLDNVKWVKAIVENYQNMPEWAEAELMLETRVQLSSVHPEAFGTTDIALVIPFEKALILDYKNGTGPVETQGNRQLAYYAIGLQDAFSVDKVECGILQPRVSKTMAKTEVLSCHDLEDERARLASVIAATEDDRVQPCKGEHCHWCPAKDAHTCPEWPKQSLGDLLLDTTAVEEVRPAMPFIVEGLIPAKDMTPDMRAMVLHNTDAIKRWLEEVNEYCVENFDAEPTPGFSIALGREGVRKWAEGAEGALKVQGVKESYLYDTVLVTPTQLEKRMGAAFKKLPENLIVRSEGKKKLVANTDSVVKSSSI
jgi:hypothetical protein